MNKRLKRLLFEAYRRDRMGDIHEQSKPLHRRWLGLGTKTAYKEALDGGYMMFHDGNLPPPRCMGWLVLTDKGVDALKKLESEFKPIMDQALNDPRYKNSIRANYMLAGGIVCR